MEYHVYTADEIRQMILAAVQERATYFEGEAKLEDRKGAANQNKIMLYQFGQSELNGLASAITMLPDGEMRDEAPSESELIPPEYKIIAGSFGVVDTNGNFTEILPAEPGFVEDTSDPIMERELEEMQEMADAVHVKTNSRVRSVHRPR